MEKQVRATDFQGVLPVHKLLVSAVVLLGQGKMMELQRGMVVKAVNGIDVGVVAAVVMGCSTREVTHVLLGTVPPTAVYRLIPLGLIQSTSEGALRLSTNAPAVTNLACYKPS